MKKRGFTLVELMIVVVVISILAAVSVPRFADLINKSRAGATKGNLGAIRSALYVYYADNEGRYPTGPSGAGCQVIQNALTANVKYLKEWPYSYVVDYHARTDAVACLDTADPYAADPGDDGEWAYVSNSDDNDWGKIMVECYHRDPLGVVWSTY